MKGEVLKKAGTAGKESTQPIANGWLLCQCFVGYLKKAETGSNFCDNAQEPLICLFMIELSNIAVGTETKYFGESA
jgi:hypothetical protein